MLSDNHLHSHYSFDSETPIKDICDAAVSHGFERITITDHADIDGIADGIYPPYEPEKVKEELFALRPQYEGKLDIAFGVELGQPHLLPQIAKNYIDNQNYNLVLGSVHNFEKEQDFYFFEYQKMSDEEIDRMYRRYILELQKVASFPGIQVLTHATYPRRYAAEKGHPISVEPYRELYEALFETLIQKGVALELNSKMTRKGMESDPNFEIMSWYYQAGGRLISFGSDAHRVSDFGIHIPQMQEAMRAIGFKEMLCGTSHGVELFPL